MESIDQIDSEGAAIVFSETPLCGIPIYLVILPFSFIVKEQMELVYILYVFLCLVNPILLRFPTFFCRTLLGMPSLVETRPAEEDRYHPLAGYVLRG